MGAPKQKWTSEEEAALKAGIHKYGIGKWSAILKDPEFSHALRARSNVDLKDKWRNLNCMAAGFGSRQRPRVSNRNTSPTTNLGEDTIVRSMVVEKAPEDPHITLAASSDLPKDAASIKQSTRMEVLILEAITKLKEPRGSSRHAIARYIEENYQEPIDSERTLAASLKELTEIGRLVKVKNQYRIAPKDASMVLTNGAKEDVSEAGRIGIVLITKAQIDAELEKMKNMNPQEAAAAAARAVAEAEKAMADAEAAAMEAEEAEAEAEAAQCFHDAAQKALTCQTILI